MCKNNDHNQVIFSNWRLVRSYVVEITRSRYTGLLDGTLTASSKRLGNMIDRWNKIVIRSQAHHALGQARALFWTSFGDITEKMMHSVVQVQIESYKLPTVDKLMSDQVARMASLKRHVEQEVKRDREATEKAARGSGQYGSTAWTDTKRKRLENEVTGDIGTGKSKRLRG